MQNVLIKYYSAKMYSTLDIQKQFEVIFNLFGDCKIEIEPMNPDEKEQSISQVDGIKSVRLRFMVFAGIENSYLERRYDLERIIVDEGQK